MPKNVGPVREVKKEIGDFMAAGADQQRARDNLKRLRKLEAQLLTATPEQAQLIQQEIMRIKLAMTFE